jgi:hypothetical protein
MHLLFSSNKSDETPPYSLMVLESSIPKTLVAYPPNFQNLVQFVLFDKLLYGKFW